MSAEKKARLNEIVSVDPDPNRRVHPRLASRLRSTLPLLSVDTVRDLGWTGWKDHVLIPEVEGRFDVFVTIDKGVQQIHLVNPGQLVHLIDPEC
jgi:hypothetical protein